LGKAGSAGVGAPNDQLSGGSCQVSAFRPLITHNYHCGNFSID